MSKAEKLEALLARVQGRRGEARPETPAEKPAKSRPRSLSPLERAAAEQTSGFAPRPASAPPPRPASAPPPARPAKAKPKAAPAKRVAKAAPKAAPEPPTAPYKAPAASAPISPAPISAKRSVPPSAPIAKAVGELPAAETFGELIDRALALRP